MKTSLTTFSKLWTIINQVYLVYRDQESSGASLAFALFKFSQVLRLVDNLPLIMARSTRTPDHALMLQ